MPEPLNILLVEDSPDDADLSLRELRRAGFDPKWKRVETEPDFLAEIKNLPDIILSDYSMPHFSGLRAAELLQASGLNIPFILISGTVGEDIAVESMKHGATDYLLKDRLARLGSSVQHALEEKRGRDEHKRVEDAFRASEERYRTTLEQLSEGCQLIGFDWRYLYLNDMAAIHNRRSNAELLGKKMTEAWPGIESSHVFIMLRRCMEERIALHAETEFVFPDGSKAWFDVRGQPVPEGIFVLSIDISERKRAEDVLRSITQQQAGRQRSRIAKDLAVILAIGAMIVGILAYSDVLQPVANKFVLTYENHLDDMFSVLGVALAGFSVFVWRRWKDIKSEVGQQARIEEALRIMHGELEKRIQQRTVELTKVNKALQGEISERKRVEESLKLFRLLVDRSNDGIEVIDPATGRFLDVNEVTCQRLGYSRAELLSMNVPDIESTAVTPDTWPAIVEQIRQSTFKIIEGIHRRKDGSAYPVEVNVRLVRADREYLVSIVRDITERRRAEEDLRASEEKFRQIAENINEVFWVTDPTMHEIVYVSPAYEKIWGRSCESLYASPRQWMDAIHLEDHQRVLKANEEMRTSGIYDAEYRITRPDKTECWIHDRGFPVRNAAGEFYRIVGTAEDITERKKLQAQFLQAQKMEGIGQLAGGVAHDFNNILAVIQMQSELLKGSAGASAEQSEFADEIGITVQRAAALTRQLLLFSRREVFQPSDLDLNASVTNTAKMLTRIVGESNRMQLKLASQPMFIHADAGMMDQVLMNLVVNARDAMPNGGQLIIETAGVEFDEFAASQSAQAQVGSFVRLSVSDSGCGIPPEVLPKIFEPFFTTKDVGKGTGLGLATVFGIVQQHQGWVNVYSEVGHGTTFQIYLPRLARNMGQKSSQPGLANMPGGNETILLAEDDPSLRVSVRQTLSRLGYRILEVPTGIKAMEVWRENRDEIRLLLTDMVMPDGMTGKDLAQRILQEEPQMKVIYMSGYSAEVIGRDFPLKEGVNFLIKPFQAAKLAQTIRNCLDGSTPPSA